MPVLTEKQIKYGFNYYHRDESQPKSVIEVSQYQGETILNINCTQLGDSLKEKKRVLQEWCNFLSKNPTVIWHPNDTRII